MGCNWTTQIEEDDQHCTCEGCPLSTKDNQEMIKIQKNDDYLEGAWGVDSKRHKKSTKYGRNTRG